MNDVQRRKTSAYWYAVGRHDVAGGADRSDQFAEFAEKQAAAYYAGEVTFLASVLDQWREFVAELEVTTPARSSLCRLCGHGLLWQSGCWQSAEHGYACPAADPTDDRHQTAVVDGREVTT
jgi:hypothetical protein